MSVDSLRSELVEAHNAAALQQSEDEKLVLLTQMKEIVLHRAEGLLKEPEIMNMFMELPLTGKVKVKKWVVSFVEEVAKKNIRYILSMVRCLLDLARDSSVIVSKAALLAFSQFYKRALIWVVSPEFQPEEEDSQRFWQNFVALKDVSIRAADSDNEGIQVQALKFWEIFITCFTPAGDEDEAAAGKGGEVFTIESVPRGHPFLDGPGLNKEATDLANGLVERIKRPEAKPMEIKVSITVLGAVARARTQFLEVVSQALCDMALRPPASIPKSQLKNIHLSVKNAIIALLKVPAAEPHFDALLEAATELGARDQAIPHIERVTGRKVSKTARKRAAEDEAEDTRQAKRPKRSASAAEAAPEKAAATVAEAAPVPAAPANILTTLDSETLAVIMGAVDAAKGDAQALVGMLHEKGLNIDNLVEILTAISSGQAQAPPLPAGLAEQPVVDMSESKPRDPRLRDADGVAPPSAPAVVGWPESALRNLPVFTAQQCDAMFAGAFERIVSKEVPVALGGGRFLRDGLLASLAVHAQAALEPDGAEETSAGVEASLLRHIFEDAPRRIGLAQQWLFHQYNVFCCNEEHGAEGQTRYKRLLIKLIDGVMGADAQGKMLGVLIVHAPDVPEEVVDMIKGYCLDKDRVSLGLNVLRDLVLHRIFNREAYLEALLRLATDKEDFVRAPAIRIIANTLFAVPALSEPIELYATEQLRQLVECDLVPGPTSKGDAVKTEDVTAMDTEAPRPEGPAVPGAAAPELQSATGWTEDRARQSLLLYLALCTKKPSLLHGLVSLYVPVNAYVKRLFHMQVPAIVRQIGISSPALLDLIRSFAEGAEALVLLFLRSMTEAGPPSPQLVDAVREVYARRSPDARFLIPVLSGLHKDEIKTHLPRLIALPNKIVKAIVNTLLNVKPSPVSPAELLVALHLVNPDKDVTLKMIVEATQACFDQRNVYKQDVLAVVLQQLVEKSPIPALLMRTVIQTVTVCPRLTTFIMSILSRLIAKQVWSDARLWDGFVRCCKMTQPHSFGVLLQLPRRQFEDALKATPEIKEPLIAHVKTQETKVPRAILVALGLKTDKEKSKRRADDRTERTEGDDGDRDDRRRDGERRRRKDKDKDRDDEKRGRDRDKRDREKDDRRDSDDEKSRDRERDKRKVSEPPVTP